MFLPWKGDTILGTMINAFRRCRQVREVLLVGGGGHRWPRKGPLRWIPDRWPGRGPLGGLITGLSAARFSRCFVAACDMPFLKPAVVREFLVRLNGCDAAALRRRGRWEPLCAAYRRRALSELQRMFRQGIRSPAAALSRLNVAEIRGPEARRLDPGLRFLWNVNTPADYRRALR